MPKDVKLSTVNQANNDKEGSQSLNERLKSGKMVAAATVPSTEKYENRSMRI